MFHFIISLTSHVTFTMGQSDRSRYEHVKLDEGCHSAEFQIPRLNITLNKKKSTLRFVSGKLARQIFPLNACKSPEATCTTLSI